MKIEWEVPDKIKKEIKKIKKSQPIIHERIQRILAQKYFSELKKMYKYEKLRGGIDKKSIRVSHALRLSGKDRFVFEEVILKENELVKFVVIKVRKHYNDH